MSIISELAIHDRRLEGTLFRRPHVAYIFTDELEPIDQVIRRVRARLLMPEPGITMRRTTQPTAPVDHIRIYAHGARPPGRGAPGDGRVLLLGRENLTRDNAESFGRSLRWLVRRRIWLHACSAAAQPDGEALCRNLARGANVPVVAGRELQDYSRVGPITTFRGMEVIQRGDWIDFGVWEGEVVVCHPDGTVATWFAGPAPVSGRDRTL